MTVTMEIREEELQALVKEKLAEMLAKEAREQMTERKMGKKDREKLVKELEDMMG